MGSSFTGIAGGPQSPHTGAHGASEIDIILKNIFHYTALGKCGFDKRRCFDISNLKAPINVALAGGKRF